MSIIPGLELLSQGRLYEPVLLMEGCRSRENDWLALRKIGGSDAPVIAGLNPYKTRYKLYLEKRGEMLDEPDSEPARWGHLLERVIAEEFEHRTALVVKDPDCLFQHPVHDFMTCTPDRLVFEDGEMGVLQVKNRNFFAGKDYEDDGIGDDTHIQLMHEIYVMGVNFAYAAVLIGGNRLLIRRVERDERVIEHLINQERDFWDRVQRGIAPQLAGGDDAVMNQLYPGSGYLLKSPVYLPESAAHIIADYLDYKGIVEEFEDKRDAAKAQLKQFLGEYERGIQGDIEVTWKANKNGVRSLRIGKVKVDGKK